jgi:lambda family phage portal protein
MQITYEGLAPPSPDAPNSLSASFEQAPRADFTTATNGAEPRLAWARSTHGAGFSFSDGGLWSLNMGGRTARDAALASRVSNDLATSNAPIATLLLNLTTQAIGTGLTLSSKPRADEIGVTPEQARDLSNQIETKWAAWAGNPLECDIAGRFDVHQMAGAFYRNWLLNGESLATLEWLALRDAKTKTKVNVLDISQLDRSITRSENGRNIIQGVAFDQHGRVAGYMLRPLPLGAQRSAPQATYVEGFTSWGRCKVIHAFQFDDPRQVRGLSPLTGALTPAKEQDTLAEFTLGKALIDTSFTTTIESSLPTSVALDSLSVNDRAGGIASTVGEWLDSHEQFYSKAKITPQVGTVTHLMPGDKLMQHESESPSNNFDAFDKSLLRKTAKAAGAAYEDISGDYADTSFSASRLATALPHEINLRRRKDIAERFYRAVFKAWLEESIATGTIKLPAGARDFYVAKDAYCSARFLGKGRVSPDEKKTREATILGLETGLISLTEAYAEDGKDFEAQMETLQHEKQYLESVGLEHPFFAAQQRKRAKAA